MAGIGLLRKQPLNRHLGDLFTQRAMNNGVLFNLTGAGHQLPEQRLVLLAQRCFLFHSAISSFFIVR